MDSDGQKVRSATIHHDATRRRGREGKKRRKEKVIFKADFMDGFVCNFVERNIRLLNEDVVSCIAFCSNFVQID